MHMDKCCICKRDIEWIHFSNSSGKWIHLSDRSVGGTDCNYGRPPYHYIDSDLDFDFMEELEAL